MVSRWAKLRSIGSPTSRTRFGLIFRLSSCLPSAYFSTRGALLKKSRRRKRPEETKGALDLVNKALAAAHRGAQFQDGLNLSNEQSIVYDLVVNQERNVFFTGAAGTGKSVLLKKMVKALVMKHGASRKLDRVAVTASTGLAAFSIGGTTLHRFAGIGLGKAPIERLIRDIADDPWRLKRWRAVQVLVIDEISMIDAVLFDKLDTMAQALRDSNEPFGGIQLVVTGDFFQLPPVVASRDDNDVRFCFESQAWKTAIEHTVTLVKVYRQADPHFSRMLDEMRQGSLSPATVDAFRRLRRPLAPSPIQPTDLFPLRNEADRANDQRMQALTGPEYTYMAKEDGIYDDEKMHRMLLNNCSARERLVLKEGAQVMLIKNLSTELVNGSQGRVIGFSSRETFRPEDWEEVDKQPSSTVPETGPQRQSAADSPPHNPVDAQVSGESHHIDLSVNDPSDQPDQLVPYPVVRFGTEHIELCSPQEWSHERWVRDPSAAGGWRAEALATRVQVPLIPSWALSIHKSQGQSLDRVRVDLSRVFERGQAYVALSRARTMDGLQVQGFSEAKVTAHPKVRAFYEGLSAAEDVTGARTVGDLVTGRRRVDVG